MSDEPSATDSSPSVAETRELWDRKAAFWDERFGEGNEFHRLLIEPATLRLLDIQPEERILDIACGNGALSRRLAGMGAQVLAFDFSSVFLERARARSTALAGRLTYQMVDATDRDQLLALGEGRFDAAVAGMALMDMPATDSAPASEWALRVYGAASLLQLQRSRHAGRDRGARGPARGRPRHEDHRLSRCAARHRGRHARRAEPALLLPPAALPAPGPISQRGIRAGRHGGAGLSPERRRPCALLGQLSPDSANAGRTSTYERAITTCVRVHGQEYTSPYINKN